MGPTNLFILPPEAPRKQHKKNLFIIFSSLSIHSGIQFNVFMDNSGEAKSFFIKAEEKSVFV